MRIALIGHGKMGKELEKAAIAQKHEVVLIIRSNNADDMKRLKLSQADVAVEFSTPSAVVQNIYKCFDANIPVVVGTTGWYDQIPEIKAACEKNGNSLIYASNFSIGVNILFELNRVLARIMNHQPAYEVSIEEIHHTQKMDSPSGTAISLAKEIIENIDRKKGWVDLDPDGADESRYRTGDLKINSMRMGDIVGTHIIKYVSNIDQLELRHEAYSRAGFVQGALVAASFISGRKGFFTMKDMLHISAK